jgi:hypothetical protein
MSAEKRPYSDIVGVGGPGSNIKRPKVDSRIIRQQVIQFCDELEVVSATDTIRGPPLSVILDELLKYYKVQLPPVSVWSQELAHQLRYIFGN